MLYLSDHQLYDQVVAATLRRDIPLNLTDEMIRDLTVRLRRSARKLVSSDDDADDLMQASFERFLKCLPQFNGSSSLSTFAIGILINVAKELQRQRSQVAPYAESLAPPVPGHDAFEQLHLFDGIPLLHEEEAALVLQMEGFSAREACAVLQLSKRTYERVLQSAKAKVERALKSAK